MRGYAVTVALLLACLCCFAAAATATAGGTAENLKCYICNSLFDPDCDSPVNEKYLIDCSVGRNNGTGPSAFKPVANAAVCWKQRQDIEGLIIVDRMCGHALDNDKKMECYDRVGTRKIKVRYCVCDRGSCNGSLGLAASATFVLTMVLTGLFASWARL